MPGVLPTSVPPGTHPAQDLAEPDVLSESSAALAEQEVTQALSVPLGSSDEHSSSSVSLASPAEPSLTADSQPEQPQAAAPSQQLRSSASSSAPDSQAAAQSEDPMQQPEPPPDQQGSPDEQQLQAALASELLHEAADSQAAAQLQASRQAQQGSLSLASGSPDEQQPQAPFVESSADAAHGRLFGADVAYFYSDAGACSRKVRARAAQEPHKSRELGWSCAAACIRCRAALLVDRSKLTSRSLHHLLDLQSALSAVHRAVCVAF